MIAIIFCFVSRKAIYLQCLCEISRQLACPLLRLLFIRRWSKIVVANIANY